MIFYTWLMNAKTGEVSDPPVCTDYFIGDVGEIVVDEKGEELVIVDYVVEEGEMY